MVPVPFALHPDDVRGAAIPDQPIEIRALFPLLVGERAAVGHPVRSGCCEALWGRYSASGPAISRTCVDAILNGDRPVRRVSPDGPFPRKPWEAPARRKRNLMPELGKRHGACSTPCSWGSHSRPAYLDRQPARRLRLPGSWIPDSLRRVQEQVETAPVPRRPNLSTAAIHP